MRQSAEGLLDHFSRQDLESSALGFLDVNSFEPWAVACSGGADSVLLLWLMWLLFPEKRNDLRVLHFDHGTRGQASVEDAEFVRMLAEGQGLPFYMGRGDNLLGASEAKLRAARLDFFHGKMEETSCRILLQGHQLNDVSETLLMRLSRGSGAGGLAAPRPVQIIDGGNWVHVRPLLGVKRDYIRQGLRECGLAWREDSSNVEMDFFRNRIRRSVLPVLQSAAKQDVLKSAARSRRLLQEDDTALDAWATKSYLELKGAGYQVQWPKDLPPAVIRRMIHLWLSETDNHGRLSADALEDVLQAIAQRRETSFSLGRETLLNLRPNDSILEIIPLNNKPLQWANCVLPIGGTLYLPSGAYLQCLQVRVNESFLKEVISGKKDPACFAFLDADALGKQRRFFVRTRNPEDRYQPLGMNCSVKLQNLLVNQKVPASIRDFLPVVTLSCGEVLWCPGCPGPENYRLSIATKWALTLKYIQR